MKNALVFATIVIIASIIYSQVNNEDVEQNNSPTLIQNTHKDNPKQHKLNASNALTNPQITADDCVDKLSNIESADFLQSKYTAQIDYWLNSHSELSLDSQSKYQLARTIGISTSEYQSANIKFSAKTANDERLVHLAPKQTMVVMGHIQQNKYNELAASLSNGLIPKRGLIIGEPILTTIIESDPAITISDLSSLLETGLAVTLEDLQYVTKNIVNSEVIKLIATHNALGQNLAGLRLAPLDTAAAQNGLV